MFSEKIDIGISWSLEEKECAEGVVCTKREIINSILDLAQSTHSEIQGKKICQDGVDQILFYSTAGMRLAEQMKGKESVISLYSAIKEKIDIKSPRKISKKSVCSNTIGW